MTTVAPPNAEEAQRWNCEFGTIWVAHQERIDALLEPIGARALVEAHAAPGERVLDVGCGAGTTTLALERSVGAQGRVVGLDV